MPSYRLIDGQDNVLHAFNAADDEAGKKVGRVLSIEFPQAAPRFGTRNDFRVERQDGDDWRFVIAWVPEWLPDP